MLTKIFIQNFALIEKLNIDFEGGLQVITGETGAGKSIILGALRLIMGERADIKSLAHSQKKSIIEAEFIINKNHKSFLEENDIDFEEHSIIRREILPSGKSRAFINDIPVTLDILKEFSSSLINIHSQFETDHLFNQVYQFAIIDGLSENKSLLTIYQKEFSLYQSLQLKLKKLKNELSEKNKESDYKNFLLQELREAHLDEINWENLQDQISELENSSMITENLSQILQLFDHEDIGVLQSLNNIKNRFSKISSMSAFFSKITKRLEQNFIELKDIHNEIENISEKIISNPEKLEQLNTKVNLINHLNIKHNTNSIDELIQIREKLSSEQDEFADIEASILKTEKQLEESLNKLDIQTKILNKNRESSIPIFRTQIESLLKQLGLEKARIEVELTESDIYNNFGKQNISLLFQANSGFPMKPIQSTISGGERSRVMLAVKKLIIEHTGLPTLVLDEIDSGVSGKVAEEIGNIMQEMGKKMQLIVVTHLAQVAAKGTQNYKVIKYDVDKKTQSCIIHLNQEEKLYEVAQLLSGSKVTDAALQQAKELIGQNNS